MSLRHYHRKFMISAAHFGSQKTYDTYRTLYFKKQKIVDGQIEIISWDDLLAAFRDIHGHNFEIEIDLWREPITLSSINDDWIVDDVQLTELVEEWSGVNLSTLPEFADLQHRATTERIAEKLAEKIGRSFELKRVIVTVNETSNIASTAEWFVPECK